MSQQRLIRYLENGEYKYASVKDIGDLAKLKVDAKQDIVSAINYLIDHGVTNGGISPETQETIDDLVEQGKAQQEALDAQQGAINDIEIQIGDQTVSITDITAIQNALKAEQERLTLKASELEQKANEIMEDLVEKADLSYVDGELVKKIDVNAHDAKYEEIVNDLTEKVNVETYTTEYNGIVQSLKEKADSIDLGNLKGRVDKTEKSIVDIEGELSSKITHTEFDDAVGVNKWVASRYLIDGTDLSTTKPSFELLRGQVASEVTEVDDSSNLVIFNTTDTVTHYFTNAYLKLAKTISLNIVYDSSIAVFVNGASVYENTFNNKSVATVSLSLRQGWNTIEILHGFKSGTPVLNFNTTVSSLVDKMTTTIGVGDKNETRLTQAETQIKQTADEISLKADKTIVDNIGNRVTETEGSITVLSDEINSKVSNSQFSDYTKRLTDAESQINQTAESIESMVNRTEYDTLNGRFSEAETTIKQHTDAIALTASKSELDELDGRISNAETSIQANTDAITLTAKKTDLDTVSGRLSDAEASIKVATDEISQRVTKTEFDSLEIGGRNLVKNSSFSDELTEWTNWSSAPLREVIESEDLLLRNVLHLKLNGSNQGVLQRIPVKKNANYTLSYLIHVVKGTAGIQINRNGDGLTQTYIQVYADTATDIEFQKITKTFTSDQHDSIVLQVGIGATSLTDIEFYITNIQLEEGSKATDWTPNPDDVDNKFNDIDGRMRTAETTITQTATQIALKADASTVYTKGEVDAKTDELDLKITDQGTLIKQTQESISLKASKTDVYTKTESKSLLDAKANGTDLDALVKRVETNESELSVQSDKIEARVTKTEFNNLEIGGRNYAVGTGNSKTFTGKGGTNESDTLYYLDFSKIAGKTFTLSFDATSTVDGGTFRLQQATTPWLGLTASNIPIKKGLNHYSYTASLSSGANEPKYLGIRMDNYTGSITISNLKLEIGSKATDYTPAPEDVDSRIANTEAQLSIQSDKIESRVTKTEFNSLEIGGRNILRNTSNFADTGYWARGGDGSAVIVAHPYYYDNTKNLIRISANSSSEVTFSSGRFLVEPSKEYTFSTKIFNSANIKSFDIYFLGRKKGSTSAFDWTIGNTGNKASSTGVDSFTWTFKTPSDCYEGYIRIDNNGRDDISQDANLYVAEIKLEKGNKVTDWTPNPDDVDARIASAETKITQTESAINLKANATNVYTKSETDTKVNSKADQSDVTALSKRVTEAESELSVQSDKIEARVTKVEFDGLEIGGRNLLTGTSSEFRSATKSGWGDYTDSLTNSDSVDVVPGQTYTARVYLKTSTQRSQLRVRLYESVAGVGNYNDVDSAYIEPNSEGYVNRTFTIPANRTKLRIFAVRFDSSSTPSNTVQWKEMKLETGTKATDWTPAPEDISLAISDTNDKITYAESRITQTEKEITSKVAKADYTGSAVVSMINQTADNIRIQAKNIDLNGAVTFNSLDSSTKGVLSNFDATIINANPIFLDWSGSVPSGYSAFMSGGTGSTFGKASSSNGMGNALKIVSTGSNSYLQPNAVTNQPFYQYVTIESTFMLESGSLTGSGILFRYTGSSNGDHHIKFADLISSPETKKWYTITKVIKRDSAPAGFSGYQVFPMGAWTGFGTVTAKTIQYDSIKTRPSTEQEINAYESSVMIADMSSDGKVTPVEKVQLKKEWATITAEKPSYEALANTYGISTEKTNFVNAYNTLNNTLNNSSGGVLINMGTTSTVTASTFRAQFDDYYDKKAILTRKINETARSLANSAQSTANTAKSTADSVNKTVNDNKNTWDTAYSRVNSWTVSGTTKINGGMLETNTVTASHIAVGDFTNYASWINKGDASTSPWYSQAIPDTSKYHTTVASLRIPPNTYGVNLKTPLSVTAGEVIYYSFWVLTDSNWDGKADNSKLRFGNQSGTLVKAVGYDGVKTSWTRYTGTYTVSNGVSQLQFSIGNDGSTGNVWIDDFIISKMTKGELIVDGSLTADKINGGTFTGGEMFLKTKLQIGNGGQIYMRSNTYYDDGQHSVIIDPSFVYPIHVNADDGKATWVSAGEIYVTSDRDKTADGRATTHIKQGLIEFPYGGDIVMGSNNNKIDMGGNDSWLKTGLLKVGGAMTIDGNSSRAEIKGVNRIDMHGIENSAFVNLYLGTGWGGTAGELRVVHHNTSDQYRPIRTSTVYAGTVEVNQPDGQYHVYLKPRSSSYEVKAVYSGTTDGWVRVTGKDFYTASKEEYKSRIEDFHESALNIINKGKIKKYDWKQDHTEVVEGRSDIVKKRFGFVIDENKNEVPEELLAEDGHSVSTYQTTSVLWKAVQELSAKIDYLEKKLAKK